MPREILKVTRMFPFRRIALALCFLAIGTMAGTVNAADEALVGALALAADNTVADQLKLSDDQRAKLKELIGARDQSALAITRESRSLPEAEKRRRMDAFAHESETLGARILGDPVMNQLRLMKIAKGGMRTIVNPKIAEKLVLSAEQVAQAKVIVSELEGSPGDSTDQARAIAETERKLAGLLTREQRAAWEKLTVAAGDAPENNTDIVTMWTQVRMAFEKALGDLMAGFRPDWSKLPTAIAVLVVSWLLSLLAYQAVARFCKHRKTDETLAKFLARTSKFAIMGFGILTALQTMNLPVHTLVAGIGLSGLVLGIAMKDVVSNAISGVMLMLFRPFRHRDHIKVGDFEGEVCDIDMRYTHLDAGEKVIFVPNAMMFSLAVTVKAKAKPDSTPDNSKTASAKSSIAGVVANALAAGKLRFDQGVEKSASANGAATTPNKQPSTTNDSSRGGRPTTRTEQPARARTLSALQSDE